MRRRVRRASPDQAPFDAIVVAAATPTVPPALVEQLRAPGEGRRGGRLVIPIGEPSAWFGGQELVVLERVPEGIARRKLLDVVFVPLVWDPPARGSEAAAGATGCGAGGA